MPTSRSLIPVIVATTLIAGVVSACGGSGSGTSAKSFTDASDIASALGCSGSYVSEQRFASYNSGHCTYNGHHTYLVACKAASGCKQIANNIDALATVKDNTRWLLGSDWIIDVASQDLPLAQKAIGGVGYVTVTPS